MKVWVVAGNYEYEGYELPDAVFSTQEAAWRHAASIKGEYDDVAVEEYEVDDAG